MNDFMARWVLTAGIMCLLPDGGSHTWHGGNVWGQILFSLPFEWLSCYTVSGDCYQV